jgi:hypothetical protein
MLSASEMLCQSEAKYSESPQFVFKGKSRGGSSVPTRDHISSFSHCRNDIHNGTFFEHQWLNKKTHSLQVIGKYDYDLYQGNKENGLQDNVSTLLLSIALLTLLRLWLLHC